MIQCQKKVIQAIFSLQILVLILCLPVKLHSQNNEDLYWVNFSYGFRAFYDAKSIITGITHINFSYSKEPHLFSTRFLIAKESEFCISPFGCSTPELNTIIEAGILYGRVENGHFGKMNFSAGLALVSKSGGGNQNNSVGLPIETSFFTHGENVGIGFTILGNINSLDSFIGFALSIQMGKLRADNLQSPLRR